MEWLWLIPAVALTVAVVTGHLDDGKRLPVWRLHAMTSWVCIAGGGVYGLGVFDGGLMRGFNWLALGTVVVGSWVWLWRIRDRRVTRETVEAYREWALDQKEAQV